MTTNPLPNRSPPAVSQANHLARIICCHWWALLPFTEQLAYASIVFAVGTHMPLRHFPLQAICLLTLPICSLPSVAEVTGYPWSAGFSAMSSETDGQKLNVSLQQGIEWQITDKSDWTISPYIGLNYDRSNIPIHSWNNATKPKYGVELSNNFRFGVINWGEVRVGWQRQRYYYKDNITLYRETDRKEAYVRMYMNGNWSQ